MAVLSFIVAEYTVLDSDEMRGNFAIWTLTSAAMMSRHSKFRPMSVPWRGLAGKFTGTPARFKPCLRRIVETILELEGVHGSMPISEDGYMPFSR